MRSFEAFSDHDFEFFVADLLGTIENKRYEVFARGADMGVDLRHFPGGRNQAEVVQCKRYTRSTYAHLKSAAKSEARILRLSGHRVSRYRLVTTLELTQANKAELAQILGGFVTGPEDIVGAGDLEAMLDQHKQIERRHPKLWLTGGTQLETILNNGTYQRSRQLLEETKSMLGRYVETKAFAIARERLRQDRVLIIAGSPGIGKTTLARMLLADAALDGYESLSISGDAEEAYAVLQSGALQAFYYDDFLGTTFLQLPLIKNEDKRIAQLIQRVAASETSLFVMTTREHILKQALETSELLTREGIDARRYLLELSEYTSLDKARIFYNHIWASGQLDGRARKSLLNGAGYQRVLEHHNYNPRLIEHITGLGSHRLCDDDLDNYLDFALGILDEPKQIWRHAFEHQLDTAQRGLLVVLASMQSEVVVDDLEVAFRTYCEANDIDLRGRLFERTLQVLDDSFIAISHLDGNTLIKPANPSIIDFIALWLRESPDETGYALEGAAYFPQVEWIERSVLSEVDRNRKGFLREGLADALQRLLDSPETRWQMAAAPGRTPTLARTRQDRALRLVFIVDLLDRSKALGDDLGAWLAAQIESESSSWEGEAKYDVDLSSVIWLVESLQSSGRLNRDFVARLKTLFEAHLDLTSDWNELCRMRKIVPNAYTRDEWKAMQARFAEFAAEAIDAGTNHFRTLQEVSEIEVLATRMDVALDRRRIKGLWEEVADEIFEEESEVAQPVEEDLEPIDLDLDVPDEQAQIEALFERLAVRDGDDAGEAPTGIEPV